MLRRVLEGGISVYGPLALLWACVFLIMAEASRLSIGILLSVACFWFLVSFIWEELERRRSKR